MNRLISLALLVFLFSCAEFDPGIVVVDSQNSVVLPDSVYDLENADTVHVSKHYRGHIATFVERSDSYGTNQWWAEIQGMKYSTALTVFNNGSNQNQKDAYNVGLVDFGCYTHSTTYTTVWSTMAPVRAGLAPTVLSYASGVTTYASAARTYYMGGFNSIQDTSAISYEPGLTDMNWISHPMAMRSEYQSENATKAMMADVIPRVISEGGIYSHFFHWHSVTPDLIERYLFRVDSLINGADVYRGSANTAVEYYFVRESVDSIKYSGKTVDIYYHPDYPSSPYSRINTPLWVYVDLSGTSYAGNDITTSHGGKIRAMGNDKYYISVPLDYANTSVSFDITTVSGAPAYINLSVPTLTKTGQVFTTDQPCTFTVFRHLKTDPATKWVRWKAVGTPATSYTAPAFSSSYDHRVAVVTAEKKTTLGPIF